MKKINAVLLLTGYLFHSTLAQSAVKTPSDMIMGCNGEITYCMNEGGKGEHCDKPAPLVAAISWSKSKVMSLDGNFLLDFDVCEADEKVIKCTRAKNFGATDGFPKTTSYSFFEIQRSTGAFVSRRDSSNELMSRSTLMSGICTSRKKRNLF